jgi:hypothetical protein
VLPQLQFTRNGVLLHVALETAASLIALLAGFLVFGRLRRSGNVNDLLLACALAVFVLLNLCFLMTPALAHSLPDNLIAWILLVGRSLGAVLFALAAVASHLWQWRPTALDTCVGSWRDRDRTVGGRHAQRSRRGRGGSSCGHTGV